MSSETPLWIISDRRLVLFSSPRVNVNSFFVHKYQLPPSKCSTHRVLNLVCTCVFLEVVYQDKHYTRHNEMICPCGSWNDWKRNYSTGGQIPYLAFTIGNTMSFQVACINNTLYIIWIHGLVRQESLCSLVVKASNRYRGGHVFEACK